MTRLHEIIGDGRDVQYLDKVVAAKLSECELLSSMDRVLDVASNPWPVYRKCQSISCFLSVFFL